MKFEHTRAFLREQRTIHRARALLKRRGVGIAAYAMFRLNRMAQTYPRHHPHKDTVYALKNSLLEHLYGRGYCVTAKLHKQILKCNSCGGTGWNEWYDEECWKCDGTGIYRTIELYLFRFRVGDESYSWHQPAPLVTWKVNVTDDAAKDYEMDANKKIIPLYGERLGLLTAVVYEYLRSQNVSLDRIPSPRTLWASLYLDTLAPPLYRLVWRIEDEWNVHVQHARSDVRALRRRINNALYGARRDLNKHLTQRVRLPECVERIVKRAGEYFGRFYCDELGCFLRNTTRCTIHDYQTGKDDEWYYCSIHAKPNGFCWGCGQFWCGVENFDFSRSIYCSNCQEDFENDDEEFDAEFDEDYYESPF